MTDPTNLTHDAVGESSAVLRVSGDEAGGTIYYAVRRWGYGFGDQADVKSGTGADWHGSGPNGSRVSISSTGLTDGTTMHVGCYIDDGQTESNVITDSFVTSTKLPDATGGRRAARIIG